MNRLGGLLVLSLLIALLGGCGKDPSNGSPSGPTTPTATGTGSPSGPTAPCTATIVIQPGSPGVVITGSPGATVSVGNFVINFTQNCDFSATSTTPAPLAEITSRDGRGRIVAVGGVQP